MDLGARLTVPIFFLSLSSSSADKTKWTTIKADIRVAGAPSNRGPSTAGEKRAKAPRREGAAADGSKDASGASKKSASSVNAASTASATGSSDKRATPSSRPAGTPKVAGENRKAAPPAAGRPDFPLPQRPTTLPSVAKVASSTVPKPLVPSNSTNDAAASAIPSLPASVTIPNGIVAPSPNGLPTSIVPQSNGVPVDGSMQANAFRGAPTRGGVRGGPVRGGGRGGMPRKPFTGRPNLNAGGIMPFHEHDSTTLSAASYPYSPEPPFYPNQPVLGANQPYRALDPYTLDPTRYWLLGQLEWYMSVSNLARDLYLRTKVSPSLSYSLAWH
jgi:la-related protein 1